MRIVRFTLSRQEKKRRGFGVAVAAFGLMALSGLALAEGLGTFRGSAPQTYAVRIALPRLDPQQREPIVAQEAARTSDPLPATEPASEPTDTLPPVTEAPPARTVPLAARAKIAGMIPLDYSLSGGAEVPGAIEVEKSVSLGGADAGRIPLRIDGNAKVYALGSKLAEIIAKQSGEKAVPAGLERDFVSLERLRALGIGVRYDATRDRLIVDPPAA